MRRPVAADLLAAGSGPLEPIALVVAAALAAAATMYAARVSHPTKPAGDPVDDLAERMWEETLTRLDELGADRDAWRKRAEAAEARELDALRRLARGDAP